MAISTVGTGKARLNFLETQSSLRVPGCRSPQKSLMFFFINNVPNHHSTEGPAQASSIRKKLVGHGWCPVITGQASRPGRS